MEDHAPADPLIGQARPPATDGTGSAVSAQELEAAAELSRLARRLGLDARGIDGFALYRIYTQVVRRTPLRAAIRSRRQRI